MQPAVMMLNVYDGAELPRIALDIYQQLLNGALQFAQTILGAARPAVSDGENSKPSARIVTVTSVAGSIIDPAPVAVTSSRRNIPFLRWARASPSAPMRQTSA